MPRTAGETIVVVVDDSADVLDFMSLALGAEGYRVLRAVDAESAYDVIAREHPDVVITDVVMGALSGLDLIIRMRSNLAPPLPPVIVCSGFPAFAREAMDHGAYAFLTKPFEFGDLHQVIQEALAGRAPSAALVERATHHSRELRARVLEAAELMFEKLAPDRTDMKTRAGWGSAWLQRYLGFGRAFLAFVSEGQLRVEASTDEQLLPPGHPVETMLPFVRDIIESGASIALPDVSFMNVGLTLVRFFLGAPLTTPEGIAIGALCVVDPLVRPVHAEDLLLIELLGNSASDSLRALSSDEPLDYAIPAPGLISRRTFHPLLSLELSRARHIRGCLEVAIATIAGSLSSAGMLQNLQDLRTGSRSACCVLGNDQVALFVARKEPEEAAEVIRAALDTLRDRFGLVRAGVVSLAGAELPMITAPDVMRFAQGLIDAGEVGRGATIERVVLRREPWGFEAEPAPP